MTQPNDQDTPRPRVGAPSRSGFFKKFAEKVGKTFTTPARTFRGRIGVLRNSDFDALDTTVTHLDAMRKKAGIGGVLREVREAGGTIELLQGLQGSLGGNESQPLRAAFFRDARDEFYDGHELDEVHEVSEDESSLRPGFRDAPHELDGFYQDQIDNGGDNPFDDINASKPDRVDATPTRHENTSEGKVREGGPNQARKDNEAPGFENPFYSVQDDLVAGRVAEEFAPDGRPLGGDLRNNPRVVALTHQLTATRTAQQVEYSQSQGGPGLG
jgi:hypothetical protein